MNNLLKSFLLTAGGAIVIITIVYGVKFVSDWVKTATEFQKQCAAGAVFFLIAWSLVYLMVFSPEDENDNMFDGL
jgi:hypothetical protein